MSEVRWTDSGSTRLASGKTLLYSGMEVRNHQYGVGLLLNKKTKEALMEWELVDERIMRARFKSKIENTTVIPCYIPTNVASQEAKEAFYTRLQGTLDKAPNQDIVVLLGDLNAKVGKENKGKKLIQYNRANDPEATVFLVSWSQ